MTRRVFYSSHTRLMFTNDSSFLFTNDQPIFNKGPQPIVYQRLPPIVYPMSTWPIVYERLLTLLLRTYAYKNLDVLNIFYGHENVRLGVNGNPGFDTNEVHICCQWEDWMARKMAP